MHFVSRSDDTGYHVVPSDAQPRSGKVLNSNGSVSLSWILSGMEWAVQSGAPIVNMSLGAGPSTASSGR